jgi:arylsulfatase A-like enzyme
VRAGDWKLIRSLEDNTTQLFNLKDDTGENQNRAADMPGEVAELNQLLDGFLKDTGAALPKENPEDKVLKTPVPSHLPVKHL